MTNTVNDSYIMKFHLMQEVKITSSENHFDDIKDSTGVVIAFKYDRNWECPSYTVLINDEEIEVTVSELSAV